MITLLSTCVSVASALSADELQRPDTSRSTDIAIARDVNATYALRRNAVDRLVRTSDSDDRQQMFQLMRELADDCRDSRNAEHKRGNSAMLIGMFAKRTLQEYRGKGLVEAQRFAQEVLLDHGDVPILYTHAVASIFRTLMSSLPDESTRLDVARQFVAANPIDDGFGVFVSEYILNFESASAQIVPGIRDIFIRSVREGPVNPFAAHILAERGDADAILMIDQGEVECIENRGIKALLRYAIWQAQIQQSPSAMLAFIKSDTIDSRKAWVVRKAIVRGVQPAEIRKAVKLFYTILPNEECLSERCGNLDQAVLDLGIMTSSELDRAKSAPVTLPER